MHALYIFFTLETGKGRINWYTFFEVRENKTSSYRTSTCISYKSTHKTIYEQQYLLADKNLTDQVFPMVQQFKFPLFLYLVSFKLFYIVFDIFSIKKFLTFFCDRIVISK